MSHRIHQLKENLYLITWLQMPKLRSHEEEEYIKEISEIFENADEPIYFISDMRRAHLSNPRALRAVAKVMNHPNFGAGASFSNDAMAEVTFDLYRINTLQYFHAREHEAPELFHCSEDALAFMEDQMPGITEGIDWERIFQETLHMM